MLRLSLVKLVVRCFLAQLTLRPWRWRYYVPPKRQWPFLEDNTPHSLIFSVFLLFFSFLNLLFVLFSLLFLFGSFSPHFILLLSSLLSHILPTSVSFFLLSSFISFSISVCFLSFFFCIYSFCRSQWSRRLRLEASSLAQMLGSWVSNPTWGMDVCVRLFFVSVVLCVGSGLASS
jgi:hypothetical protein